jgi:hypothetical protein
MNGYFVSKFLTTVDDVIKLRFHLVDCPLGVEERHYTFALTALDKSCVTVPQINLPLCRGDGQ